MSSVDLKVITCGVLHKKTRQGSGSVFAAVFVSVAGVDIQIRHPDLHITGLNTRKPDIGMISQ